MSKRGAVSITNLFAPVDPVAMEAPLPCYRRRTSLLAGIAEMASL